MAKELNVIFGMFFLTWFKFICVKYIYDIFLTGSDSKRIYGARSLKYSSTDKK